MIDANSRSLRIRVTGRAQSVKGLVTRSVVAALKRDSFLDFLWFTDFETSDPVWYSVRSNGRPTGGGQGDLMTWAATNCPEYYRKPWQRGNESWDGKFTDMTPNQDYSGNVTCDNIAFISGDKLAGPMHTNDELLTCGTPTFGRNAQDRIESGNGYRSGGGGCGGSPDFQGTLVPDAGTIGMPATNATLATDRGRRRLHLQRPHQDHLRHRAGQDQRDQHGGGLQQHAAGVPGQRRHLRRHQRLVLVLLGAAPVVLHQGGRLAVAAAEARRVRLRRRDDQRHLRHRPDDRHAERHHRQRRT